MSNNNKGGNRERLVQSQAQGGKVGLRSLVRNCLLTREGGVWCVTCLV